MDFARLRNLLIDLKEPSYRFSQIASYYAEFLPKEWDQFRMLPKSLRYKLKSEVPLRILSLDKLLVSKMDGAQKALLKLQSGNLIETVYIPLKEGVHTACISCQVGCAMKCSFCATGQMGFSQNLSWSEIISQIYFWNKILKEKGIKINRVVFMGMGEPMLNYNEVVKAIEFICSCDGLGLSKRRITISSVGIVPKLYELMNSSVSEVELAISLHAPNDEIRNSIMPINRLFPVKDLMEFCQEYSKNKKRKIYFEYVLLEGINNSSENARELASLLLTIPRAQVNMIHYHPTGADFHDSGLKKTLIFQKILRRHGLLAFIRKSAGIDIKAACGQLKIEKMI